MDDIGVGQARLRRLMAVPTMNANLLANVMNIINDSTERPQVSRKRMHYHFEQTYESSWSRIVETHQMVDNDGNILYWDVVRLQKLLPYAVHACAGFAALLARTLETRPSLPDNPWQLVLYEDEITPGNQHMPLNRRNINAMYVSFLEFGRALCTEEAWIPIGVLRATLKDSIASGYSQATRVVLRSLFVGEEQLQDGIRLDLATPQLLFVTFGMLLADEDAMQSVWCSLGSSGTICCLACRNVTPKQVELAENDDSGWLVDVCCADPTKFDPATDADLYSAWDQLAAMKMRRHTAAELQEHERAWGVRHHPQGLLADIELRSVVPPHKACRGGMHHFFSNGVANVELRPLLRTLADECDIDWKLIHQYCGSSCFKYPAIRAAACKNSRRVFNKWSAKSDSPLFPGSAGDIKTVVYTLRHMLETSVEIDETNEKEINSFLALAECIDVLELLKFGDTSDATLDYFTDRVKNFFRLSKLAYKKEMFRPKHHGMFHIPTQVRIFLRKYLDCFTAERKNKNVGTVSSVVDNTLVFERSVGKRLLHAWIESVQADRWCNVLCEPSADVPPLQAHFRAASVRTASALRWDCIVYSVGDVIAHNKEFHLIDMCLSVDGILLFCARPLVLQEEKSRTLATYRVSEPAVWLLPEPLV